MKISDYKNEIEKIEPSLSFISETEALMKQMRDGRNIEVKRNVTLSSAVLRSAAAAAAVLVCAAAVRFYIGNSSPAHDIAGPEITSVPASDSGETASFVSEEAEIVPAGDEITDNNSLTSDQPDVTITSKLSPESQKESCDVSSAAENDSSVSPVTSVSVTEDLPAVTVSSAAVTSAETVSSAREEVTSVTAAPAPPETTVTSYDHILTAEEFVQTAVTSQSAPITSDISTDIYDSAEAEENIAEIYEHSWADPPVYLHDMDNEGEDVEESYEEEEDSYSDLGSVQYYGGQGSTPDPTPPSLKISGTEEICVPDNIGGLENGTYYLDITAGFDSIDEKTGSITGGNSAVVDDSDEKQLKNLIRCIDGVTYRSSAEYSDGAVGMTSYRYRIEICSSLDGENGAVMFEIMYDSDTLVINRYDNGSESSEKYSIPESDSRMLDSVIGSAVNK